MLRVATLLLLAIPANATDLPGFRRGAWFDEQVREQWVSEGARVHASAATTFDPKKPTRLIVFATPNGNSIEQTLGCGPATGLDWHFDIQHVAAQVRAVRAASPNENVVLACTEADGLSWPAWKRKYADGPARIRKAVELVRGWLPSNTVRVTLACHSGGGSFLFGYIDSAEAIPADIDRFVFLDANYSYSDADKHGDKLLTWLNGDKARKLVVVAYDDRNIKLNGKLVVGPTGGTFRATERMRTRFGKDVPLKESVAGDFSSSTALGGQIAFHVHANPANIILHTALVGEMNGLIRSLADDITAPPTGPREYTKWVQTAPGIPPRPKDSLSGSAFVKTLEKLTPAEREVAIADEIIRGNIPDFLRTFHKLTLTAKGHIAVVEVMPDYLAVGSDDDFVRLPMTPMTAARIADAFDCALPTRKLVDDTYTAATVKLEPRPLTKDRESLRTFVEHHTIIEGQRAGRKLGELVAGIKKDVIVTNRLGERPNRVAIYGWHKLDATPIQPPTIVHVNWYVDYSHGGRLMKRAVTVDGKPRDVRHVLYATDLWPLVSDEGPVTHPTY